MDGDVALWNSFFVVFMEFDFVQIKKSTHSFWTAMSPCETFFLCGFHGVWFCCNLGNPLELLFLNSKSFSEPTTQILLLFFSLVQQISLFIWTEMGLYVKTFFWNFLWLSLLSFLSSVLGLLVSFGTFARSLPCDFSKNRCFKEKVYSFFFLSLGTHIY